MTAVAIRPPKKATYSLGWQVLEWTYKNLLQPDGPNAGRPWEFTDEQARFIYDWYSIDEHGRFVYRYAMLRRMKGWGKDPVGAAICCVEFVGPCRFSHFDGKTPVAKRHPAAWVQTAAVSKDQTRNTMTLFPGMMSPDLIKEFGIDLGKEIIYAERGKRRIEAVTSSPRALEGGRATFVLKNETHHWRAVDEGHEMAKVIARNTAKSRDGSSRVLAISNAHAPGEDSDAEHDFDAHRLGTKDMLYDCLEAPETDLTDDESLMNGLYAARGDSVWLDVERLAAEIRDPRTTPAMARRFYLNQIVAEEDKPFDSVKWAALAKPGYIPPKDAVISLGFDGSLTRDHTALIGTEMETGHQWVVGYWEPRQEADGVLRIPFMEVDQTVDYAFERWDVFRMNADPYKWGTLIDDWAGRYSDDKVWKWSTTNRMKMAKALQDYRIAIETEALTHDGDPRLSAGIANSHKMMLTMRDDDQELMWLIQKERPDSPLKIDAAVAGCLSWEARMAGVAEGLLNPPEPSVYEGRGVLSV
jgi:hypothetical protein